MGTCAADDGLLDHLHYHLHHLQSSPFAPVHSPHFPSFPLIYEACQMTRAIAALLEIMSDMQAPLRRRIEAAEGLLAFEAPEEIVERSPASWRMLNIPLSLAAVAL